MPPIPHCPVPTPLRRAFTLIEMLVVLAVIIGLAGVSLWIGPRVIRDSEARSTQATVAAVATAIASDGRAWFDVYDPLLGESVLLPAWDIDADGVLDGRLPLEAYREQVVLGGQTFDPTLSAPDPDPVHAASRREFERRDFERAHRLDYRGAMHDLGNLVLPDHRLDEHGRIVDAWGRPLRILHRGASQAPAGAATGSHFIGIYSVGRDGADQEGQGDDITSW